MKMIKFSALCLAASAFASTSAMAWESEDGNWSTSANVAISSDYVWRGASQTENEAAISGGFDVGHSSGLYAGVWGSNVDFNDDASMETDVYFGYGGDIADSGFSYDVSFLRYMYDGEDYDWNEYIASVSYSFFTAGIAYSDDVFGSDEDGIYYSLGFDYSFDFLDFTAGIGYYDLEDYTADDAPDGAVDYLIGVSKEIVGLGMSLTYTDTDSDGEEIYGEDISDGRVFFTISKDM